MNNLLTWIKDNPIRSMFLVPIFLVAGISISHVVAWYDITNPFSWAIYLSVAIEIGAITALIAATQRIKGGVWFMFGLVTFVQMVGNIFYSYKEIDPTGELFTAWVELTSPIFELFGTESTDVIAHKRWLAILGGGLLPVISLTSLHFFVKYEEPEKPKQDEFENDVELEVASLIDLEKTLEIDEENEEFEEDKKPKSKRGRKKKEVIDKPIEELPEPLNNEDDLLWLDTLELKEIENSVVKLEDEKEVQIETNSEIINVEENITDTKEVITETTTIPPIRPTKLTYTKPNVSIDRL